MKTYIVLSVWIILLLQSELLLAQKHHQRLSEIDVQHYAFDIKLSDETDEIIGKAQITLRFKKSIPNITLDLIKIGPDGKGMVVESVYENGEDLAFIHNASVLKIPTQSVKVGESRTYTISYSGIPVDGLYISKNKFGDRTFFADNYPDRGKYWLPLVDHPSDKATVEWRVTAPNHYQTVANGLLQEETNVADDVMSHWKMDTPISTKVMVFGTARFAVEHSGELNGIPVSAWIYPQDRDNGFSDFSKTKSILDYFISHLGDYSFKKLAGVQSKTRFGGMENAGNIFYGENMVTGKGEIEALLAHEIAHQWFGNSATEGSWHHLWLSEGFATYCTDLYWEHIYGRDAFVQRMQNERKRYLDYAPTNRVPIINPVKDDYLQLLSPLTYQKAAWVLHMLRREIGDDHFRQGLREYYKKYKYSNALSEDFQTVMEQVSGHDLSIFFKQWLYQSDHPLLDIAWSGDGELEVLQKQQTGMFSFPLDVKLNYVDGTTQIKTVEVSDLKTVTKIGGNQSISSIDIDPGTWLLFELEGLQKVDSK